MKWLRGYVICISHQGAWERFMNMCRHHRINLWKIQREEEVCFSLAAKDFKKNSALSEKDGNLSAHKTKKGIPVFSMADEDELDILFRFSFISCFALCSVFLRLGNSVSRSVYIYKRNAVKNSKFDADSSRHETKPPCL